MEFLNPSNIAAPASNYSQAVIVPANARRLVISGQIGARPDGTIVEGLEAQFKQTWDNIDGVLRAAGMTATDVVKITTFVTDPAAVGLARQTRDAFMNGHRPASTFLVVAGLASPKLLVEIEAEAVKA
jgi:enamine deaminase RidA (YjgF/YER057c/UK114 family)